MDLPGTKCGCREGDCGACTVLEGTCSNETINYKSIVSCLTPLVNVHGKHIVTIEGLNMQQLSPVQKAVSSNSATQCGFCTPGVVVSLTSFCLSKSKPVIGTAIASVSGNICRCTGYKSIERAASEITGLIKDKSISDPVKWLVNEKMLPDYFLTIPDRLSVIRPADSKSVLHDSIIVSGGTDLFVKRASELSEKEILSLSEKTELKSIISSGEKFSVGASVTASEIGNSELLNRTIPGIKSFLNLVASEQVRNTGTLAGNIVNASPAADLSVIFLALRSSLTLEKDGHVSNLPLNKFYTGYKSISLENDEIIRNIVFPLPEKQCLFNFEKVSRRTHLDIATVNSAVLLRTEGEMISECCLSAGGVSPFPLFLERTSAFLVGKTISFGNIAAASLIIQEEVTPISDIRGSIEYKRLLLRQLFFAHFKELFPDIIDLKELTQRGREVM